MNCRNVVLHGGATLSPFPTIPAELEPFLQLMISQYHLKEVGRRDCYIAVLSISVNTCAKYLISTKCKVKGQNGCCLMTTFLADRTGYYSRAYGTMLCASVCRLSVTFCIVAKRYVVEGRRWYRWIGRW